MKGGDIVQISNPPQAEVPYPLLEVVDKELKIHGSYRYTHCYDIAVEMLSSGRVHISDLITHRFSLSDAQTAFRFACDNRSDCLKVIIQL